MKNAKTVLKRKKKTMNKIMYYFLIAVGIYLLQIFLCKIKYKIFGCILPFAFFCGSVANLVKNLKVAFNFELSTGALIATGFTFFIYNIPTIILLFVYAAYKKKIKL